MKPVFQLADLTLPLPARLPRLAETTPSGESQPLSFSAETESISGYIWALPFEHQQASEWCWASIGLCLGKKAQRLHAGYTQCQFVSTFYPTRDWCCPTSVGASRCNEPREFNEVLEKLGWAFSRENAIESWIEFDEIKDKLDDSRPVVAQIKWRGRRSQHLLLICGYQDSQYGQYLYLLDPLARGRGNEAGKYDRRVTHEELLRYVGYPLAGGETPIGEWVYTFFPRVAASR